MGIPWQRHGGRTEAASAANRINPIAKELKEELRGVIAFVNDHVIPPVRMESIHAAHVLSGVLAGGLRQLADQLDGQLLHGAQSRRQG